MPNFAPDPFQAIRSRSVAHCFDLLELNGQDWRKRPLLDRKCRLARRLAKAPDGIEFNQHIEGNGAEIFLYACALGHEGIVAKRIDLMKAGRSKRWLKIKNPGGTEAGAAGVRRAGIVLEHDSIRAAQEENSSW